MKKLKNNLILFFLLVLIPIYSQAIYELFQVEKETDTIMVIVREIFDQFVDTKNFEKAIICLDQYFTNESYCNAAGYLLCGASKNNDLEVIKLILEKVPGIVNKEYGYNSLNAAIMNKHEEAANILVDAICLPLKTNPKFPVLILHYGLLFNNSNLINFLLEKAPFLLHVCDKYGNTVAHYAAIGDSEDKLCLIFSYIPKLKHTPNQVKQTPLLYACLYGKTKAIKILLQRQGYDYFKTNYINSDNCVLHALFKNGSRVNINIMLDALNLKNSESLENIVDNYGNTIFHTVCKEGNMGLIMLLLRLNDQLPNILNNKNMSPLDIAIKYDKRDVVNFLTNHITAINHDINF